MTMPWYRKIFYEVFVIPFILPYTILKWAIMNPREVYREAKREWGPK
jgi:hypothetical protein